MTATEPIGKPMPTQASFSISPRDSRIGPWTSAAMVVSRPKNLVSWVSGWCFGGNEKGEGKGGRTVEKGAEIEADAD